MKPKLIAAIVGILAALIIAAPASAATVRIVSMQFSNDQFVPYIRYEGVVAPGDVEALGNLLDTFVRCADDCFDEAGKSVAVVSMDSPGGSYAAGLELAKLLRERRVTTLVENGSVCYSACAFAFLGGTGFSTQPGIGPYIERIVEPGAVIGFHAPYFPDKALVDLVDEFGVPAVLSETRDMIAIMVRELVDWNVSAQIISRMVSMGPDETYDLATPNDLFLIRAGLPQAPLNVWQPDLAAGIRNVCLRLLALHKSITIDAADALIGTEFNVGFGRTEFGNALSGYAITDAAPLGLRFCAIQDFTEDGAENLDIALFTGPGIAGDYKPAFSFFNRRDGWSTAGTGGTPTQRIFTKGTLSSYFLAPRTPLDALEAASGGDMVLGGFPGTSLPALPAVFDGLTVVAETASTRISASGNVFVFEMVGPSALFEAGQRQLVERGATFSYTSEGETAFIRTGDYDDGAGGFSWIGFDGPGGSALVRIEILNGPDSGPVTDAERTLAVQIACSINFGGQNFNCNS